MMIDLRSDTVTKPTPTMKEAMFAAPVGDDVFGEDPTINELEAKAAAMFGMEAGIYCPSGTQTNQIAVKLHTQPLDEIILDKLSHIYNYEIAGYAYNSSVGVNLLYGDRGRFKPEDVLAAVKPDDDHLPVSRLVCMENTVNKGGGCYYTIDEMRAVSDAARSKGLGVHLDGARLFNALVALSAKPQDMAGIFDTISICLSKGLGCPVGSVLIGSKEMIGRARRIRKVMGGGMRQAGILAAAGVYALDNHIERLAEDHRRAKVLGDTLAELAYVGEVMPVNTNIVIFEVTSMPAADFQDKLQEKGVYAYSMSPTQMRFVTHLDYSDEMLEETIAILKSL